MQTGYRFRCYPTAAQKQTLLRWIGCQRFIYNAKVGEDRYFRAFRRKALALAGMQAPVDQQYAQFIGEDTAFLREVPSPVLRNGAVRWKQAYGRYFAKLARRPKFRGKSGEQSVWITSELFRFEPVVDTGTGEITYRLFLGTKKFPVGEIACTAHRPHQLPASITLTVDAGRWYLSFSNEDGQHEPKDQETADWLSTFTENELTERAVGLDRGVTIPLCASNGKAFDLFPVHRTRIEKKRRMVARWQRRLSRRTKDSSGWKKAKRRIGACRRYGKDVRREFAHQTSHVLAADPKLLLFVFEALGVQRMTKRPKAKQGENGQWLRNGRAAKAGLSRAILGSAWGQTKTYLAYKAKRASKLVIEVKPHHSSQECARCGHVHPDNRISQSVFVCQRCGLTDNADANASKVIAKRGVSVILSGTYRPKGRKRAMQFRSTSVGPGRSERERATAPTPSETRVSRASLIAGTHRSKTSETPATAQRD